MNKTLSAVLLSGVATFSPVQDAEARRYGRALEQLSEMFSSATEACTKTPEACEEISNKIKSLSEQAQEKMNTLEASKTPPSANTIHNQEPTQEYCGKIFANISDVASQADICIPQ